MDYYYSIDNSTKDKLILFISYKIVLIYYFYSKFLRISFTSFKSSA